MHLRIHRPPPHLETRSYQRAFAPLSPYVTEPYVGLRQHNHWNGKSAVPNLKTFATDSESTRPCSEDILQHHNFSHTSRRYAPSVNRAGFKTNEEFDTYSRSAPRWPDDDLENYFPHMRIAPRCRDIISKDNDASIVRPSSLYHEDINRGHEPESPVTSSTNENDKSVSEESLGTLHLASVNGNMGSGVPERNRVFLEKIRMGLDKRTTIMIKNVPNKYTQVRVYSKSTDASKCLLSTLTSRARGPMISCTSASISRTNASIFSDYENR